MSERPTPETDAIQNRHWNRCTPDAVFQLGNHARCLERQRDELAEALSKLCFVAMTSGGTAGRDESLCAAIDAATALLARLSEQSR